MDMSVELMRLNRAVMEAQTVKELGEALFQLSDIYMDAYPQDEHGYPKLNDMQLRYHRVAKRLTGYTSLRRVLEDAILSDSNFPVRLIQAGAGGVTLIMPHDEIDQDAVQTALNAQKFNTSQVPGNTLDSEDDTESV